MDWALTSSVVPPDRPMAPFAATVSVSVDTSVPDATSTLTSWLTTAISVPTSACNCVAVCTSTLSAPTAAWLTPETPTSSPTSTLTSVEVRVVVVPTVAVSVASTLAAKSVVESPADVSAFRARESVVSTISSPPKIWTSSPTLNVMSVVVRRVLSFANTSTMPLFRTRASTAETSIVSPMFTVASAPVAWMWPPDVSTVSSWAVRVISTVCTVTLFSAVTIRASLTFSRCIGATRPTVSFVAKFTSAASMLMVPTVASNVSVSSWSWLVTFIEPVSESTSKLSASQATAPVVSSSAVSLTTTRSVEVRESSVVVCRRVAADDARPTSPVAVTLYTSLVLNDIAPPAEYVDARSDET